MTAGEFLSTVKEQIRCQKAREPICRELEEHILSQAQDYEKEGMGQAAAHGANVPLAVCANVWSYTLCLPWRGVRGVLKNVGMDADALGVFEDMHKAGILKLNASSKPVHGAFIFRGSCKGLVWGEQKGSPAWSVGNFADTAYGMGKQRLSVWFSESSDKGVFAFCGP